MSSGLDLVGSADDPTSCPTTAGSGPVDELWCEPELDSRDAPSLEPPTAAARLIERWEARYATAVVISDLIVVVFGVSLGAAIGWGKSSYLSDHTNVALAALSTVLVMFALMASRCWDTRILGAGAEEFSRLTRAFMTCSVVLGLTGLALQMPAVRPWVFGVIPGSWLLAMIARYVLRQVLHGARRAGRCMLEVLAVGAEDAVADLVVRTRRVPYHGWVVTGACTPTGVGPEGAPEIAGVPVVGDLDAIGAQVRAGGYRVVAVAPAPGWTSKRLQRLAWDIEGIGLELVVDPGLMEVAGPRLHMAPVDGLPLLRLTEPRFTGVPRVVKNVLDRAAAVLLLLLLAPFLVVVAVGIRLDGGPVFFRQTRVGLGCRTFRMVKFRSMVVDAESRRGELVAASDGAGPLFKMRKDPRVTRVGAWLRRYSLDELPQLFNVLGGSMSLVGPRPPLPEEVESYADDARRKFLVRPGLTGLWQVSGRSDLSWEESVRLDLRYVENWSPVMDLAILWKTVWAVIRGDGAY